MDQLEAQAWKQLSLASSPTDTMMVPYAPLSRASLSLCWRPQRLRAYTSFEECRRRARNESFYPRPASSLGTY